MQTLNAFDNVLLECRSLFEAKTRDYGTSWRVFRLPSLTDQLYIKACRIRNIEQKGYHRVSEGVRPEWMALVNYAIMALIQLELGECSEEPLSIERALGYYDQQVTINRDLLANKNHDYGEAWREMRPTSLTDMVLVKLLRIKQIESNRGQAEVSEGVEGGYRDILNYAVFALIRQDGESNPTNHPL
ncbi:MAG: DUF1599 domain-containing protein [Cytophagia bacterium]|nr:DUF1599 domain-containing protein [Cytophagia bacterium]